LEKRFEAASREFADKTIPMPEDWGGFLLLPETIEFWQGRESRLHDRFLYTREGGLWKVERLCP
jgi:pyridoxamine 5'-phosphate oxidase